MIVCKLILFAFIVLSCGNISNFWIKKKTTADYAFDNRFFSHEQDDDKKREQFGGIAEGEPCKVGDCDCKKGLACRTNKNSILTVCKEGLEIGRICSEGCVYNKDEVNKKGTCRIQEACLNCKEEFNCVKGKCVDGGTTAEPTPDPVTPSPTPDPVTPTPVTPKPKCNVDSKKVVKHDSLNDQFDAENVLVHNKDEKLAKGYWLAPTKAGGSFVIDLGCNHHFRGIELVNTHNSDNRDRSTKDFRVSISWSADGDWRNSLEDTLEDSLNQEDPLPLQYFELEKGEVVVQFVKFEVLSYHGDTGGGLQYFDIKR